MKKLLAILLTVCFMLGVFAACTNDNTPANTNGPEGNNNENPGQTQTQTQAPMSSGLDLSVSKEPKKDWVTYLTLANEMETFNILYSQTNKELRVLTNCIDGLLSNDNHGNLVPAIAETWGTEDGGKTWTFNLRKGVQWVNMNGEPMQEVKAEDWLVGLEWVLNFHKNEAANTSMPTEMIEGAADYYAYVAGYQDLEIPADADAATKEKLTKDYEKAKAKFEAICEKYGLEPVRLTADEAKSMDLTVFKQMVGIEAPDDYTLVYHCVAELPYFATVATYNCLYPAPQALIDQLGVDGFYACTNENMWYNGCYTITHYINGNEKVLTKNPLYWDTDCTLFDTVTYKMVESGDVAFQMFQAGELDYIELTESNLRTIYNSESNEFHDYIVEARPTKYSYQLHLCWDKRDENGDPDVNWNTAIANENFRLAWYYGLDATPYLARTNFIYPQHCANYCYTMSNLVSFSNGQEYTERVMEKLGISPDGENYARVDAAKAAEYKTKAMEELAAQGVTFPVVADYYIQGSSQTALDTANVLKQLFTDCLGDDFVTLNIKTYISSVAKEVRSPQLASFYINGWGADYGDPQNYLGQETYGMDNAYYSEAYSITRNITDEKLIAVYEEFTNMVNAANAIVGDMDARYEAYADAEKYMIEHALVIPWYKNVLWQVTHVNDYSKIYAPYGIQGDKFKNWETSVDAYTTEDYAKLAEAYAAGTAK